MEMLVNGPQASTDQQNFPQSECINQREGREAVSISQPSQALWGKGVSGDGTDPAPRLAIPVGIREHNRVAIPGSFLGSSTALPPFTRPS